MAFYELVFIARQTMTPSAVESLCQDLGSILGEQGGKVFKTEQCGFRSLAYPIQKNRKGHYVLMHLDAPVAAMKELERRMRLDESILRFLVVKIDFLDPSPSRLSVRKFKEGEVGADFVPGPA